MSASYHFDEVGRLPLPGDNVAIATRLLEAGTTIYDQNQSMTLDYTMLESHRFAVSTIAPGEAILSWELPFGTAIQPIQPGNYVINQTVLKALSVRSLEFELPAK